MKTKTTKEIKTKLPKTKVVNNPYPKGIGACNTSLLAEDLHTIGELTVACHT